MEMRNLALAAVTVGAWAVAPAAAETLSERANRGLVEVVAGSVYGSSARMAEDLADVLDDGATRRVLPVVGKGSLQDLVDLKVVRGIDVAIVQTDVLDLVKAQKLLPGMDSGLTYVAKLYNEEFHLLARANIGSINDLAGKKVNFGSQGDGTAVTGTRLFDALRIKVEPTAYSHALALEKLRSGEIAAMAFVAPKPATLFANLRAQDGVHFLAVPLRGEIPTAYVPARLTAEDYPGLVNGAVDTVAVGTAMIAANLAPESERYRNTANFVEAFFTQFSKLLEAPHHPKWGEVNLAADMPGWRRFSPADAWIKRNGNASTAVALTEDQMRDIFIKFLDERSKVSGAAALSAEQKDQLFAQFKRWQGDQAR